MTQKLILGIVGSYRKGGVIDTLVSEVLAGAASAGARTEKIYLMDKRIEFCTNCRTCMQQAGDSPGICSIDDDVDEILKQYEASDGLVLGAPMNMLNVNALTQRFLERTARYAYWPWGQVAPKFRVKKPTKKAVLITASAMPSLVGRLFTCVLRSLKFAARGLGAKTIATIYPGMIAKYEKPRLSRRCLRKANKAGRRLATR